MKSKWAEFRSKRYELIDLGRPAVFLVPSHKLRLEQGGRTVEDDLHAFLLEKFGAFTTTTVPYFGFWRQNGQRFVHDECRLYEISFVGKKRIKILLEKLASVAEFIGEDCLYFKAGQYGCLVKPKGSNK